MVIEYQIKRIDPVRAFFYNLQHSRRTSLSSWAVHACFLLTVYIFVIAFMVGLVFYDFVLAFLFAIGLVLAIPVLLYYGKYAKANIVY